MTQKGDAPHKAIVHLLNVEHKNRRNAHQQNAQPVILTQRVKWYVDSTKILFYSLYVKVTLLKSNSNLGKGAKWITQVDVVFGDYSDG